MNNKHKLNEDYNKKIKLSVELDKLIDLKKNYNEKVKEILGSPQERNIKAHLSAKTKLIQNRIKKIEEEMNKYKRTSF